MKTKVDFCCFRINNVIRVFVVEYLRQVIIVKNFIWKTETSQKRLSEDFCGVGGIPVTGQKGLSEYLYFYRDRSSQTCQNICGRTLRQIKVIRIFVVEYLR